MRKFESGDKSGDYGALTVYPKPAAPMPLPASSAQCGAGTLNAAGDEDFAGLRNYVTGDALPRIAWKVLAREQGLQVKQFSAQQGQELWLDWFLLPALATERKLEMLARWVLDADKQGLHYGLRLPNTEMPPGHGATHCAECLRTLALFGLGETTQTPSGLPLSVKEQPPLPLQPSPQSSPEGEEAIAPSPLGGRLG